MGGLSVQPYMSKILITGASGFIGSFIVEEALRRDMEVWAAVRKSTSREYLRDERINFIELDFSDEKQLREQLAGHDFDYIVHAAGATKCLQKRDFYRINTEGTKNFVRAIMGVKMPMKRFIYISSLSIYGPIRERQPYEEIQETDEARPNTAYGHSKLLAEEFLDSLNPTDEQGESGECIFPYIILRPTGVYGPREKDYFLMAKSVKQHLDFSVGFKRQDITFVYVDDVVNAVFLAMDRGMSGRKYFLTDGQVYRSSDFSNLIHKSLGNPWMLRVKAPIWVLRVVTWIGEYVGRATHKITALNNDKYNIMRQRNWRCNIEPTMDELGYHPQTTLQDGVEKTIKWYLENKWL